MKVLTPQPTQEAPYVVHDYPYGFRLRTDMRHWIETTKHGQRWVSQTLNPKTGLWNKPKASTYAAILLLGLDEKEHVISHGFSGQYSSVEEATKFRETYGASLSEYQAKELTAIEKLLGFYEKNVTWTIRTKKWKNLRTGEITEAISLMSGDKFVEVNDLGDPVDTTAEANIQKDETRAINIGAFKEMKAATGLPDRPRRLQEGDPMNHLPPRMRSKSDLAHAGHGATLCYCGGCSCRAAHICVARACRCCTSTNTAMDESNRFHR